MRNFIILLIAVFLPIELKSQSFPQAPSMPPSNFNQFPMMNNFMYTNYQKSDEKLLLIEEDRVIKLKSKIEKKTFELDSLNIKKTQFTQNSSLENDKEFKKNRNKIENYEENIKELKLKLDKSNQIISNLKSNIELTNKAKEEKEKLKAEKKAARAKKTKKADNSDYEDTD